MDYQDSIRDKRNWNFSELFLNLNFFVLYLFVVGIEIIPVNS